MKKKLISKSAFFNPRVLIGLAFSLLCLLVALLAFALYPGGKALAQKPEQNQASLKVAVSATSALNPQPANVSQSGFYPPLPVVPEQSSPTPTPCVNYNYTVSLGAIVPGTADTGNHCDDCSTSIILPFSYTLYNASFSSVTVGSNGHLTFGAVN